MLHIAQSVTAAAAAAAAAQRRVGEHSAPASVVYASDGMGSETKEVTLEPDMGPKPPLLPSPVNLLTAFLAELLTELAADPTVEVKFWRTPCTHTHRDTRGAAASGT